MPPWESWETILVDGIELTLEVAAALVIFVAAVRALVRLAVAYREVGLDHRVHARRVRLPFVQHLIFALDLLVAADILRTVVTPSMDRVIVLGAIVLIRIVLAFTLTFEMREATRVGAIPSGEQS